MSTPAAPVQSPEGISKSARKRANKKANDAAAAEQAAPVAPVQEAAPKAKSKAKAKAQPEPPAPEPAAKAKGKAKAKAEPVPPAPEPKAKAKGKAKAEPTAEPKAEPKAKAKGKAKAAPAPVPEPEPVAAEPKAKAKGKAKAKAAKQVAAPEPAPVVKQPEEMVNYSIDDGSGGDWELSTGFDKKKARQVSKRQDMAAVQHVIAHNTQAAAVPGMAFVGQSANGVSASQAIGAAQSHVAKILAKKGATAEIVQEPATNLSTVTIQVPEKKIGIVIGPGGKKIKEIQAKTGVTKIDTADTLFTITGEPQAVAQAKHAIEQIIEKGYCTLSYDDFAENQVAVHPSTFPDIIGSGGKIIIKMKETLGVEVNIPAVPKNSPPGKKFKITLAGSAEKVEQAKNVINDIAMFGHHEITHPGLVHEELAVESWYYSIIIGKAGSELRHIQKNWQVKISIPREHSSNQNVLIVGEKDQVERAKVYVEKLLWNAENNIKSGRDRTEATDDYGDDGDEEPWMQAYLYKR